MQGSLDEPPIIIRGQRWSWRRVWPAPILLIAFVSQFAPTGGNPGRTAQEPMAWLFGAIFVLSVVGLVWSFVSPPRLELSPKGIRRIAGWRTWRFSWTDIGNFRLVSLPRIEAVGFDFTDPAKASSGYRQWVRASYGAGGLLAANMEMPASELVGLLNRARERWVGAPSLSPAATGPGRRDFVPMAMGRLTALLIGRTRRRAYWIGVALVALIAGLVAIIPGAWVAAATWGLIGWMMLARGRMRDLGRSPLWLNAMWLPIGGALLAPIWLGMGLYVAFGLAAVAWLAVIVALGAIPGDTGRNRFGMPLGATDESETVGSAFS